MKTLQRSLLVTSILIASLAGSLAGAAEAIDNYEPLDPYDVSCGIVNFTYDGELEGSRMIKPTGGKVGQFSCEGKVLELTSPKFEDGFIATKDYGKIKIRFGMSLSGTTFQIWLTPEQKAALVKLRKR